MNYFVFGDFYMLGTQDAEVTKSLKFQKLIFGVLTHYKNELLTAIVSINHRPNTPTFNYFFENNFLKIFYSNFLNTVT